MLIHGANAGSPQEETVGLQTRIRTRSTSIHDLRKSSLLTSFLCVGAYRKQTLIGNSREKPPISRKILISGAISKTQ